MSFRLVSSITALICLVLFAILLVSPEHYVGIYGVGSDTGTVFLGNRAAPLFLGLAALNWLMRTQVARDVQVAVGLSMIVIFAGIAITGLWSWTQGVASGIILVAAVGECVIAAGFAWALFAKR